MCGCTALLRVCLCLPEFIFNKIFQEKISVEYWLEFFKVLSNLFTLFFISNNIIGLVIFRSIILRLCQKLRLAESGLRFRPWFNLCCSRYWSRQILRMLQSCKWCYKLYQLQHNSFQWGEVRTASIQKFLTSTPLLYVVLMETLDCTFKLKTLLDILKSTYNAENGQDIYSCCLLRFRKDLVSAFPFLSPSPPYSQTCYGVPSIEAHKSRTNWGTHK